MKIAGGTHYRDEAFQKIMPASIAMHNLGAAQELAKLWRQADSKANTDIIWAWLQADRVDDAIADAREIADAGQRAAALLVIAQELLNRAGAPNF